MGRGINQTLPTGGGGGGTQGPSKRGSPARPPEEETEAQAGPRYTVGRGQESWGQSGAGAWGRKGGQRAPHQPGFTPHPRPEPVFSVCGVLQGCVWAVGCAGSSLGTEKGPAPSLPDPALAPSLVPSLDPSPGAPPASQVQQQEGDLAAPPGAAGMLGPRPWGWPQTQDSRVALFPR